MSTAGFAQRRQVPRRPHARRLRAFELERRGAAEVVALDVGEPEQSDWASGGRIMACGTA
jgi:hypothetical protein